MDAITLMKQDHRKVEELFKQFEGLGERAHKSRANIVKQIILELTVHARIEEDIFYPAFKKACEDKDMVLEAIEEHNVAKFVIRSLKAIDETDETFDAKVTVLQELIDHHVEEEEKEMFKEARQVFDKARLTELGDQMLALKERLMTDAPDVSITMVRDLPVESHQEL